MSSAADRYVPAAGRARFARAYDIVLGLTMRESRRRPLLAQDLLADLEARGTVVEREVCR